MSRYNPIIKPLAGAKWPPVALSGAKWFSVALAGAKRPLEALAGAKAVRVVMAVALAGAMAVAVMEIGIGVGGGQAWGDEPEKARVTPFVAGKKTYTVEELQRLFQVARESGFTDDDLKKINIEAEGKTVNAWNYLNNVLKKRDAEREAEHLRKTQVYLSVREIMHEASQGDRKELSTLRDKMVFKD